VASRGSEARETHLLGPVFEEFLRETFPYKGPGGDGRIVNQVAAEELDCRRICCKVFETQ